MSKDAKAQTPAVDFLRWLEWIALISVAVLVLWFHGQKMLHAGALWRDEVNSVNIATLPSLADLWAHLRYDSFPALWFLVLRFWSAIGLGDDAGFQLLGFLIGAGLLVSTWFAMRLLKCERPLLAVTLMGCNVTILDWGDSLRAWGLGSALIVLTFALIWKVVEQPSSRTILPALISALLSVHCIYYNSLLLFAICSAGALVCAQRKLWKVCVTVLGIGFVAAISLLPYLSTMRAVKDFQILLEKPGLKLSWLMTMAVDSLGQSGNFIPWIWGILLITGVTWSGVVLLAKKFANSESRDLVLYGLTALGIGVVAYFSFLKSLKYSTSYWYYIALMAFVAIALETILSSLFQRKIFQMGRILIVVAVVILAFPNLSKAVKERRTNVDVIATELRQHAQKGDLIVINSWFYAVPFARYFQSPIPWTTVPPVSNHRVHRYDLIKEQMVRPDQSELLKPLFERMEATLRSGHYVWIVGGVDILPEGATPRILPPAPESEYGWLEAAYSDGWSKQLGYFVQTKATQGGRMNLPPIGTVSRLEDLPVIVIQGWR